MRKHLGIAALLIGALVSASALADGNFYVGLEGGQGRTQLGGENDDLVFTQGILLDTSTDREATTFGIYGGYAFARHFAIELNYSDLGETSFTTVRDINLGFPFPLPFPLTAPSFNPFAPPAAGFGSAVSVRAIVFREQQRTTFDSEALSLSVRGRYALGNAFSIFGRAGIAIHRIETDLKVWIDGVPVRVVGGGDESSAGAAVLGLGGEWSFHPNWALRLHAQRHFLPEEEEINLIERDDVTMVTAGIEYRF